MSARWFTRLMGGNSVVRELAAVKERLVAQADQLEACKADIQALRGQVEMSGHQLRERMHGIDRRLGALADHEEFGRIKLSIVKLERQTQSYADEVEKVSRGFMERLLRIERR